MKTRFTIYQRVLVNWAEIAPESPRELRRLRYLREWSHEQNEQIFLEVRERAVRLVQGKLARIGHLCGQPSSR